MTQGFVILVLSATGLWFWIDFAWTAYKFRRWDVAFVVFTLLLMGVLGLLIWR